MLRVQLGCEKRGHVSRNVCDNRNTRGVLAREPTRTPRKITWRKQSDRSVNLRHRIRCQIASHIPTARVTSHELTWREDSVSPASQSAHIIPCKCTHFHQVSTWGEVCLWSHFLYHYVVCTVLFKKNRTLSKILTKYHKNIQYAPNCRTTINFPIFGLENCTHFRHKWAPEFIKATAVFSSFLITLHFWLGLFVSSFISQWPGLI